MSTTSETQPPPTTGDVTVLPETFTLVDYDHGVIVGIATRLVRELGLPEGLRFRVEVEERSLLGLSRLVELDPSIPAATLHLGSGAFEDPLKPRQLSEPGVAEVLGRHLLRVRDRLDPAFGDPGPDDDLTLPLTAAWDAYTVGRLGRLGFRVQRQRRLYQFRVRHGFTDAVDAAFSRLWETDDLTWAEIEQLSTAAGGQEAR